MMRFAPILFAVLLCFAACDKPSRVAQYKAEKHRRDSVALEQQTQSLAYYQTQLAELMPVADSLLPLFSYEKNARFQDHGYYITNGKNGLRIKVRDDGKGPILIYQNGKRLKTTDDPMFERAQHLQIVISDIRECEKRITRTSKEVQKYEKRLQKQ